MREYLLTVICAAMVCAIIGTLAGKQGSRGILLRLTSGMFLIITLIAPLRSVKLGELSIFTETIRQDAISASAYGEAATKESLAAYIKAETEAYILDKATSLQATLIAEVSLNEQLQPETAILTGSVSEFAKFRLESILEDDLGIAKENQQWNES